MYNFNLNNVGIVVNIVVGKREGGKEKGKDGGWVRGRKLVK